MPGPGSSGPFQNYDWPNPPPAQWPDFSLSVTRPLSFMLARQPVWPPRPTGALPTGAIAWVAFSATDWPLSAAPEAGGAPQWYFVTPTAVPLTLPAGVNFDWPNPQWPRQPEDSRTFANFPLALYTATAPGYMSVSKFLGYSVFYAMPNGVAASKFVGYAVYTPAPLRTLTAQEPAPRLPWRDMSHSQIAFAQFYELIPRRMSWLSADPAPLREWRDVSFSYSAWAAQHTPDDDMVVSAIW